MLYWSPQALYQFVFKPTTIDKATHVYVLFKNGQRQIVELSCFDG